jgi:serine/threonine protein kinase
MFTEFPFWNNSESEPSGEVDDFEIGSRLYDGPYSIVFRAQGIRGVHAGKTVALKFLKHRQTVFESDRIQRELSFLRSLKHPNIVPILDDFQYRCFHCLVFPFAEYGTLEDYALRSRSRVSIGNARWIAAQMLEGLRFMHRRGFVHCDVKPANVLVHSIVNGIPQIWLCDFGLTRSVEEAMKLGGIRGTEFYQAPEIFAMKGFSEKVDEWAVGVIVHRMLTGVAPVMSRSQMNERSLDNVFRGSVWGGSAKVGKEVVKGLLTVDPVKRMSAEEALNGEWLRDTVVVEIEEECCSSWDEEVIEISRGEELVTFAQ